MSQLGLSFDDASPTSGYDTWLAQRREAVHDLALRLGVPLGHPVEVRLRDGIRLRGVLRLHEELLFVPESGEGKLPFAIDHVAFTLGEIESYIRLD